MSGYGDEVYGLGLYGGGSLSQLGVADLRVEMLVTSNRSQKQWGNITSRVRTEAGIQLSRGRAGLFYVVFWIVGTSPHQVASGCSGGGYNAAVNGITSGSTLRSFSANTGLTSTAPSTIGTKTGLVEQADLVRSGLTDMAETLYDVAPCTARGQTSGRDTYQIIPIIADAR